MNTMFATVAAALMVVTSANSADAETVKVKVTGAASSKGRIVVCLFRDGQGFPDCVKNKPVAKQVVAAAPSIEVTFDAVAPGDYAVSTFHDENGNGTFDTNFIGIPKEALGASYNPRLRIGAPGFSAARFKIIGDLAITISLKRY